MWPHSCVPPSQEVTHVKCPRYPVILFKRNLFLHIQRTHGQAKDITAQSHFQSTCFDQVTASMQSRGFNVPVYSTRPGGSDVTRCEMEDCRQYHLFAQWSGLSHSLCQHIHPLDYYKNTERGTTGPSRPPGNGGKQFFCWVKSSSVQDRRSTSPCLSLLNLLFLKIISDSPFMNPIYTITAL